MMILSYGDGVVCLIIDNTGTSASKLDVVITCQAPV